jgi:hypothetical protein
LIRVLIVVCALLFGSVFALFRPRRSLRAFSDAVLD